MIEDDLIELVDSVLQPLGGQAEPGDELADPPLEILRYYRREVRLSAVPWLGRGLSLLVLARQPADLGLRDYDRLLGRISAVVHTRFPPLHRGNGVTLGYVALITTPEPIAGGDDDQIALALAKAPRHRAVPLGLIRVNLGQEAVSFALRAGPAGAYPEPVALAEALSLRLRRFAAIPDFG